MFDLSQASEALSGFVAQLSGGSPAAWANVAGIAVLGYVALRVVRLLSVPLTLLAAGATALRAAPFVPLASTALVACIYVGFTGLYALDHHDAVFGLTGAHLCGVACASFVAAIVVVVVGIWRAADQP